MEEVYQNKWWILIVMSLCLGMTFIDITAVGIALPKIQQTFLLSQTTLQWVSNSYLLTLAVFLIVGGYLGDSFKVHRIILWGIVVFLVGSLCTAIAIHAESLITGRIIQGIGGALIIPNAAVLIIKVFTPEEKGKAMGIYASLAVLFLPASLVIGGIFTQYFSWRLIFWMNVPLCIIAFSGLYFLTKNFSMNPHKKHFDSFGFFILAFAIICLVFALMESSSLTHNEILITGLLILSFGLFLLFYRFEKTIKNPIIPIPLLTDPMVLSASVSFFATAFSSSIFIFDSIFFQKILHYSPSVTGILFFPHIVSVIFASQFAGKSMDKFGFKMPVTIGFVVVIFSLLIKSYLATWQNYWLLLPSMILFNIAIPFIITPMNTSALVSVTEELRGTTSGILNAVRQISQSIALALTTMVIVGSYHLLFLRFINFQFYPDMTHSIIDKIFLNEIYPANFSIEKITMLHANANHLWTLAYSIGNLMISTVTTVVFFYVQYLFRKMELSKTPQTSNLISDNNKN